MLYKAAGGSGQRSMTVVAPDAEGYNGLYIIKASGGKACLYIMPIQHRLDTSPLPMPAKEFERMPKAKCITCQVYVPVQLLALHIDTCGLNSPSECKIISDDESSLESIIDDADDFDNQNASSNEPPSASTSVVGVKVACPVCLDWYPKDYVELHASSCGESLLGEFEKELDWQEKLGSEKTREEKPCRSLSDIITQLAERVDSTSAFNISVMRGELFERGMVQWKRQKKSSPKNTLCINFLGEYGIDNGALRKEFITEMMKGIEAQLFEGGIPQILHY
ncbi:hypothetical protein PO909_021127 [Leuciscus waleckii]